MRKPSDVVFYKDPYYEDYSAREQLVDLSYDIVYAERLRANPDNLFHDRYRRACDRAFVLFLVILSLSQSVLSCGLRDTLAVVVGLFFAYMFYKVIADFLHFVFSGE